MAKFRRDSCQEGTAPISRSHFNLGCSRHPATVQLSGVNRKLLIFSLCDTEIMAPSADPKSVKVNLSSGAGLDIEWKDAHRSHYSFPFLRDACPCALCDDERNKSDRKPGEPPKTAPGALPMFKAAAKPESAEGVGKYAIRFKWNDSHDLGIYSWQFLRDVCPCEECKASRLSFKAK